MSRGRWVTGEMTEADLPEVVAIERRCFSNPWPLEGFLPAAGAWWRRSLVLRGRRAPRPVRGYICYWLLEGELEIQNIAIRPEDRRRGGAWALMQAAMEEARRAGCLRAWLEVRPSNTGAIKLYRRWGFREVARRKGYYEDGEDALIMQAEVEEALKAGSQGSGAVSLKGPRNGC